MYFSGVRVIHLLLLLCMYDFRYFVFFVLYVCFPCPVFVPGLHSFDYCHNIGSLDYPLKKIYQNNLCRLILNIIYIYLKNIYFGQKFVVKFLSIFSVFNIPLTYKKSCNWWFWIQMVNRVIVEKTSRHHYVLNYLRILFIVNLHSKYLTEIYP